MVGLLAFLASIVIDITFSWARMFIALFFSIILALAIGIWAARSKSAGKIIIPILDVLQTLPILAFFPFVIYIVVALLPGYIGINAAVIILIVTSMLWNIAFGVYESITALPKELVEVASLYKLKFIDRLRKLYVPACMPRVVEQSVLSWSIGLFYLVTSEIFSTGNANYAVKHGIGVALTALAFSGNYLYYVIGIAIFILFVVATRFLFFMPFEKRVTRYSEERMEKRAQSNIVFHKRIFPKTIYIHMPKLKFSSAKVMKRTVKRKPTIAKPSSRYVYYLIAILIAISVILYLSYSYPYLLGYETEAFTSLVVSFARVWLAFLVILAISIPVSVYLVFKTRKSNTYLLFFQIAASVPATILLPIIVIGLKPFPWHSELSAFIIFFLSGIWYVIFSAIASAKTLSPEIIEVEKVFSVKGFRAFRKIHFKALIPGLITGSITAIAAEWNASIVAEYFTTTGISGTNVVSSVNIGIGKLLDISLSNGNLVLMLIALINLTAMIIIVNTILWKRLYRKVEKVYS